MLDSSAGLGLDHARAHPHAPYCCAGHSFRYKDSTLWVKLFGNANDHTTALFKDRLKIRSTPCFVVFKDGKVGRVTGAYPAAGPATLSYV